MKDIIRFTSVPNSAINLEKVNPDKFSKVLWIESLTPNSQQIIIHGQRRELFSAGLQLIGEGGVVSAHKEAPDDDEWVAPVWTWGWRPGSSWGGQYRVEKNAEPIELTKSIDINSLVGASFSLLVNDFGDPVLKISTPNDPKVSSYELDVYKMPAGKMHGAMAMAHCLYFVFKTKPDPSEYHAEPPIITY